MPTPYNFLFKEILFPVSAIFFFVGSIAAVIVGVSLVLRNPAMFRFFDFMNRWISTRQTLKFAEIPRSVGPALQGWLRLFGALVLLGATVAIYGLAGMNEIATVRQSVSGYLPDVTAQVIAETAKWFLFIGNLFAVLIGVTMLFFPQTFTSIEARANKWYSMRQHTRGIDDMDMSFDKWVFEYPRIAGCIIIFLGVFLALNLGVVLFGKH